MFDLPEWVTGVLSSVATLICVKIAPGAFDFIVKRSEAETASKARKEEWIDTFTKEQFAKFETQLTQLAVKLEECQQTHTVADGQILNLTRALAVAETKIEMLVKRDNLRVVGLEKDHEVAKGIAETLLSHPTIRTDAQTQGS